MLKKIISNVSTLSAIQNAFWLIGEKIFSMALVLFVSILVARHLGPNDFGQLNYLLAIIALLSPFSSLGLNAIVTRELVKKAHKASVIMSTVVLFRLLGGIIAAVLLYLFASFDVFSQLNSLQWGLVLLSVTNIFTAMQVIDFWFQAQVLSKYIVKARFSAMLLSAIVKITLVFQGYSLSAFVWAAAFEALLIASAFVIIYFVRAGLFSVSAINFTYGLELLKQSKWLILSGIASIIYLKIDQIMLAEMVSTTEVGIYSVASRMSEVWYFFPVALVASFFPALLKKKETSEKQYQQQLQRLCDFLLLGALAVAIPISLLSDWLMLILFGEAYSAAGAILSLHIWAGTFVFMRALLSKWLLAEHLVFFSFVTHGIGAVINVALNYILIPQMQGVGAAIATVISYAFASYIVLFFHRSTRPMAMIMTRSLCMPFRLIFKVRFNNC
jgi:O-antigen/teichoic acid export membrane protein